MLPDWFFTFDLFEMETETFWASDRRNAIATELGLRVVPEIFRGQLSLSEVPLLIGRSAFGRDKMEGVYLRREVRGELAMRAKVVRPEFVQQIAEHWSQRLIEPNSRGQAGQVQCR
jgi:hypothetical protein